MGGHLGTDYELPRWHISCNLYSTADGRWFRYTEHAGREFLAYWQICDRIEWEKRFGRKVRVRVQARRYGDAVPA